MADIVKERGAFDIVHFKPQGCAADIVKVRGAYNIIHCKPQGMSCRYLIKLKLKGPSKNASVIQGSSHLRSSITWK